MATAGVNGTATTSNHIIEVEKTLGIEAARYWRVACARLASCVKIVALPLVLGVLELFILILYLLSVHLLVLLFLV